MEKPRFCDMCGLPLGDDPVFDEEECTQFCSDTCADAWETSYY